MYANIFSRRIFFYLILLLIISNLIIRYNLYHIPLNIILQKDFYPHCFKWKSVDHQLFTFTTYNCPNYSQMNSLILTYDGTGLIKYIQWIVTRKLTNIKITRLNDDCNIIHEHDFFSNSTDHLFIQVYIMSSFSSNFTDQFKCLTKINQIVNINVGHINQIYFKRKSWKATAFFQQLDLITSNFTFIPALNTDLLEKIEKSNDFTSNKWIIIDSEDLIQSNLIDCEKILTNFLSLLRLNISSTELKTIIEYDSHRFITDATWWDQSEVAERLLTNSIPSRPSNLIYSNDFYHLHGQHSFIEYLQKNRQCYNQGLFTQLQSNTIINRSSTDKPERCSLKPFDCAFSDLYSFADREQMYQPFDTDHYFNDKSLKCGFIVPSIFDKIRTRYTRNHTCETIVFTSILNCYDPLPKVNGIILSSFCFVALLDTKTIDGYRKFYKTQSNIEWDFIDLGIDATPFSVPAKSIETLKIVGQRLFPLAKWIIWLDGKAHIKDISQLLAQAEVPVIGAAHPDGGRTSASEVNPTISHISVREKQFPQRLNHSISDMKLQEQEYKHDGFYNRSNTLKLKMYDIAVFLYRNNHPCISRYLCGWHNEVNYYSYRGQLSVYYSAVRLNVTDYLQFLPNKFYNTMGHQTVC